MLTSGRGDGGSDGDGLVDLNPVGADAKGQDGEGEEGSEAHVGLEVVVDGGSLFKDG